jgi:hypothetical protein
MGDLEGVYLIGVYLTGVHLTGVHLMGCWNSRPHLAQSGI